MPEALSTRPQPYRHNFPQGSIYTGWAYPPKDYQKWSEVVFQFVHHLRERYGDAEVKTWLWEVWNEPDIDYWKGTPQEYFKLYDFSVAAVAARASRSTRRWVRIARAGQSQSCGVSTLVSRSLCPPTKLCEWKDRLAARLHQLSSQGISEVAGWSRADGLGAPVGRD